MTSLINTLLKEHLLTQEQVQDARDKQTGSQRPLHEIIIDMGFVSEEDVLSVASRIYSLPIIDLKKETLNPKAIQALPYSLARKFGVFPIKLDNDKLLIACSDPHNLQALDDIRAITSLEIKSILASRTQINAMIEQYYNLNDDLYDLLKNVQQTPKVDFVKKDQGQISTPENLVLDTCAPAVHLLNVILHDAVIQRASDVHVEPYEDQVAVRYRIDGHLKNILKAPKNIQNALAVRIKVLADLDIAETQKSQDGRNRIKVGDHTIDLRLSTIPTFSGEKIVMRLLDLKTAKVDLEQLGFDDSQLEKYKKTIQAPQGIVLITGPTGSGKTSTIYASLNIIKRENKNIVTLEDPIEYMVEGINQIQINRIKDVTFESGLKSILRQDPNVIFIGEIRDKETADMAFRSSMTGHLVFSTVHTNSAIATISRLLDLGLEPFLIASSLSLIIAQRLVRLNCKDCSQGYNPDEQLLKKYEALLTRHRNIKFSKGIGCHNCGHTGFKFRTGVYEFLFINNEIRQAISSNRGETYILELARENGFKTLLEEGLAKVSSGMTTLEELDKALGQVEMEMVKTGADINPTPLRLPEKETTPKKVLIVDDDPDIRKVVRMRLISNGYQVVEAEDGVQAIKMVNQHNPDLMIIDYMMPNMDGIETVKRMRASLATASMPIIMLTSRQDTESEVKGLEIGADDYVTKPFDHVKLLTRVKLLLQRRK